ncbi:hypothetical protein MNBD_ALPHA11-1708 [hydrothermal vent metagenome]|uniref:Uncharacterized protein n=1 Tax=hydrothermal vent metagenome TaxID=652676 RepID=A0A3B0TDL1_9ZZZZ
MAIIPAAIAAERNSSISDWASLGIVVSCGFLIFQSVVCFACHVPTLGNGFMQAFASAFPISFE